jgi:uncharacterized protein YndB with AHSA1/START domain
MLDRIEREMVLPAPPEEVWDIVTGPGWLAEEVELELVPGGEARFGSEAETRTGWVEEALAPETERPSGQLIFWWSADGEPATRVELILEPDGSASTRLRVLEERPLEILDLVGMPLPGQSQSNRGPMLLSFA